MVGGVYPDIGISDLIEKGAIISDQEIGERQVQPCSLDVRTRVDGNIWCMPYSTTSHGDILDSLDSRCRYKFDLGERRFLHKRNVYIVELEEGLDLPEEVSAKSNPKSTIGRDDIHVRLLTENSEEFDLIRQGYSGKLFLEIFSNSFDLWLPPGYSFNQIRFFKEGTRKLDRGMLEYLARSEELLYTTDDSGVGEHITPDKYLDEHGAIKLSLGLDPKDPGFKSREDAPELDLGCEPGSLPLSKYFELINLTDEGLDLPPVSFCLLKAREAAKIPSDHCAEMADISTHFGEFRAQYAGYFDPDYFSVPILEVRNTSLSSILLKEGQNITALWYYPLTSAPRRSYGAKQVGSSYQGNTRVVPAKHFHNDINPIEEENTLDQDPQASQSSSASGGQT